MAVAVASTGAGSITLLARDAATGSCRRSRACSSRCRSTGAAARAPTLDGVSALSSRPTAATCSRSPAAQRARRPAPRRRGRDADPCFSATRDERRLHAHAAAQRVDALATSSRRQAGLPALGAPACCGSRATSASGALTPRRLRQSRRATAAPARPRRPPIPYAYGFTYGTYASGGHAIALSPDGPSLYTGLDDGLRAFAARRRRHACTWPSATWPRRSPATTRPATRRRRREDPRRRAGHDRPGGAGRRLHADRCVRSTALPGAHARRLDAARLQLLGRVDPASRRRPAR